MQNNSPFFLRIAIISLCFLVTIPLQTTSWFLMFGHFPSPLFWFPIVIYTYLYHSTLESTVLTYIFSFFLTTTTSMPLGPLLLVLIILWLTLQVTKERVFTPGLQYFLLTTSAAGIFYQFLQFFTSTLIEGGVFIGNIVFLERLTQILLTPFLAIPSYYILRWLNKVIEKETLASQKRW